MKSINRRCQFLALWTDQMTYAYQSSSIAITWSAGGISSMHWIGRAFLGTSQGSCGHTYPIRGHSFQFKENDSSRSVIWPLLWNAIYDTMLFDESYFIQFTDVTLGSAWGKSSEYVELKLEVRLKSILYSQIPEPRAHPSNRQDQGYRI